LSKRKKNGFLGVVDSMIQCNDGVFIWLVNGEFSQ